MSMQRPKPMPSFLSIASEGSVLSIGSVGSFCSICSVGSACSAFSTGSWLSVGSVLSSMSLASTLSHGGFGAVLGRPAPQRMAFGMGVAAAAVALTAIVATKSHRPRR